MKPPSSIWSSFRVLIRGQFLNNILPQLEANPSGKNYLESSFARLKKLQAVIHITASARTIMAY